MIVSAVAVRNFNPLCRHFVVVFKLLQLLDKVCVLIVVPLGFPKYNVLADFAQDCLLKISDLLSIATLHILALALPYVIDSLPQQRVVLHDQFDQIVCII